MDQKLGLGLNLEILMVFRHSENTAWKGSREKKDQEAHRNKKEQPLRHGGGVGGDSHGEHSVFHLGGVLNM